MGEHGALVGRALDDLEVGAPSRWAWAPNNAASFRSLPNAAGEVPQLLTGSVVGPGPTPPSLVVVVNGTVAGAIGGYGPSGEGWTFSSMLGPYLESGANDVHAYEVTDDVDHPVLHLVA